MTLAPPHTYEDFQRHLQAAREMPCLPVDTEGTLTHPFSETWGVSFYAGGRSEYYPFRHSIGNNLPDSWRQEIKELLENHRCLLFHNAKHDLKALKNLDIHYTGKFYCSMLIANIVNENLFSKELDALALKYTGRRKEKSEAMESIIKALGWSYIPAEIMRHYGAVDAELTGLVFNQLWPEFEYEGVSGEYWDIEQDFVRLVMEMENRGVVVDTELAEREYIRGIKEMDRLKRELMFNPGSPVELGKFLIDELGLPVVKLTKGGKPSFDKEAMEQYDLMLEHRGIKSARMVLAYRGWQKTTSSNYKAYLDLISPDGRLRPNFKIHGTRTTRMSCEKPNLQQIPRSSENDWNGKLKQAFIQDPDFRSWDFDAAQLEFRLGAAYGHETKLIDIFNDPNRDIFSEMAETLGMIRQDVKTLVYTTQYGGGAKRISHVFGVSEIDAMRIKNNFFSTYKGLDNIAKYTNNMAKIRGYVKYWTGRRRHFPNVLGSHKAWNSVIQGGAFEIIKRNSLAVKEAGLINEECQLNLQVHDSLRFDIAKGKEHVYIPEIIRVLESPPKDFGVKFKIECNEWGTKNVWQPVAA